MLKAAIQQKPNVSSVNQLGQLIYASDVNIYLKNTGQDVMSDPVQLVVPPLSMISAVEWISRDTYCAGDSSGQFIICTLNGQLLHSARRDGTSILNISVCRVEDDDQYWIAVSFSDGMLMIMQFSPSQQSIAGNEVQYKLDKGKVSTCVQVLPLCDGDCLKKLLIFAATTDSKLTVLFLDVDASKQSQVKMILALPAHSDWIKDMELKSLSSGDNNQWMLATASLDKYIKLFKIKICSKSDRRNRQQNQSLLQQKLESQLATKLYEANLDHDRVLQVQLDAVLSGHEDWVHSVRWFSHNQVDYLASASADKSICLWGRDSMDSDASWQILNRFYDLSMALNGNIGGDSGANTVNSPSASGNGGAGSCGFYWAHVLHREYRGLLLLGQSYAGAVQFWKLEMGDEIDDSKWTILPAQTGHFDSVKGCTWSNDGQMLLSTSLDKTTRIWTEVNVDGTSRWLELNRPQIHGYPLLRAAFTTQDGLRFVSCSEGEKVIRVFEASPLCKKLISLKYLPSTVSNATESHQDFWEVQKASTLPALGLSNKANIENKDDRSRLDQYQSEFAIIPMENHLSSVTLWTEIDKLYAHGDDLYTLAVSNNYAYMMSANVCRASLNDVDTKSGSLILWRIDGVSGKIKRLESFKTHKQTVCSIQFSPDDRFIVTVGRDRQWTVYEHASNSYSVHQVCQNAHSRMIWDCSWLPTNTEFMTIARDKSLKVWSLDSTTNLWQCIQTVKVAKVPMSVDVYGSSCDGKLIAAVGYEDGTIEIFWADCDKINEWRIVKRLTESDCPKKSVTSVKWRPIESGIFPLELAISSDDYSLRIVKVDLE
ncbi:hypothetical protein MP228_005678 [Amoeboaphelidium protococcarum]|nr:hypothetical protein MP228_005678 [Amoeboaphelidium protococcarum]